MSRTFSMFAGLLVAVGLVAGCGQQQEEVPSGTYTGSIEEVNADEREIYVQTEDDQTLELYFTEETELLQDGETAEFDALATGQRVQVTVRNEDGELVPEQVEILPEEAEGDESN